MSSAVVTSANTVRQLDRAAQPNERVTPEQWTDVPRMTRLLTAMLASLATLRRQFNPSRVDHEDRVVDGTGTTKYRFPHGFGGRVRWWPIDWSGATAGPRLVRDASSDNDTLVLVSYTAGTLTLRIEAAG